MGVFARVGLLLVAAPPVLAQVEPAGTHLDMGLDLGYLQSDGHPSWLEGSAGKLRFDEDHDGLRLTRGFIDYKTRLAGTLTAHVTSELYDDDFSSTLDLTEAYVEWRPMTSTANRYRLKIGAFYPRISLENVGPGWGSPYSISPSAINTWVGEELRSVGTEFSVMRRPQALGGRHTFMINAALYIGNDPAGGLMAWKGWSIHDRQSRFNDKVPLPPIPRIQPGNWWDEQDPFITPLLEIDEVPGYYINAEWRMGKQLMMRAMRYDNGAAPMGIENNQFAWRTDFNHLALQATLPGDIGLLAQWMKGHTVWGRLNNGVYSVDNEFSSSYLLLTREFAQHRLTARYDDFQVTEADTVPLDENSEWGHAWTLAYQYQRSERWSIAAEWLEIVTERPAWAYFGLEEEKTETQLQLSLRLRFGSLY